MARFRLVNGERVQFTEAEELERDAEEAAVAAFKAEFGYISARRRAYGALGAELDMLYWDQVNDTTTFKDHVAAVKAAHPKPG